MTVLAEQAGPAALGVALVTGAFVELGKKAVETGWELLKVTNEVQRESRQFLAVFSSLGGGAEIGHETLEMVETLSRRLPIGTARLGEWTKALQSAGITDLGVLRKGLMGLASAQALVGDEGANTLLGTLRKVQEAVQDSTG